MGLYMLVKAVTVEAEKSTPRVEEMKRRQHTKLKKREGQNVKQNSKKL